MITAPHLAAAREASIGTEVADRRWRVDLDPGALPQTPSMTEGQRRVMRASLVHFAERGYGGSNIRDIATTLGIQAASVYKHFQSKDAILAALVSLGYDFHHETILEATLAAAASPELQLAAFVEAHVRLHCEYPKLSYVAHHEWTHLPESTVSLIERRSNQTNTILRGILDRGIAAGMFSLLDPDLTVVAISGLGMSAALWFPYQSEWSADQVIANFTESARNLCRVR